MRTLLALLLMTVVSPTAADWFESDGPNELRAGAPSAFVDMSQVDRNNLVLDAPIEVGQLGRGISEAPGFEQTWIAAVDLEGEPVGAMIAYLDQDAPSVEVINDPMLGHSITYLAQGDELYRDVTLDAFFIKSNDMFRPASTTAGEYLAGEVSLPALNALRDGLVKDGTTVAPIEEPADDSSTPIILTLIAIALALIVTLLVTWLRASGEASQSEENERKHARRVRIYRQGGKHVDVGD